MYLYKMKGIEGALLVYSINNTFASLCGSNWDRAAPICCAGLECEGVRCMDRRQ